MVQVGDKVTWPGGPAYGGIVWQINGDKALVEVDWEDAFWMDLSELKVLETEKKDVRQVA